MVGSRCRILAVLPLFLTLVACAGGAPAAGTVTTEGQPMALAFADSLPTTVTTARFPAGCQPGEVTRLITDFLAAFNAGDQGRLAGFFPADSRLPLSRFAQYFVAEAGMGPDGRARSFSAGSRAQLLAYFEERHGQQERLQLRRLWVEPDDERIGETVGIAFVLTRRAADLPPGFGGPGGLASGKGQIHCPSRTIYVWRMGQGYQSPPGVQATPLPGE